MAYGQSLILGYFVLLTIVGFALMGIDKKRARCQAWRIPERTLILTAFLGGGMGALLGMYVFHHKTRHMKFLILMPVAAAFSILLIAATFLAYPLDTLSMLGL